MSSGSTQNYQLNQWQSTDRVLMSEFNSDNQKIDAALNTLANQVAQKATTSQLNQIAATIPKIATGIYQGNGQSSRVIPLSFTPKAVLVMNLNGQAYFTDMVQYSWGGLAVTGGDVFTTTLRSGNTTLVLKIVNNGFTVYYYSEGSAGSLNMARTNDAEMTYYYIAFG